MKSVRFIYPVLLIASLLFCILYIDDLSFYLFVFLLIIPVIMLLLLIYSKSRLNFSLATGNIVSAKNSSIPLIIKISNRSVIPVSNVRVYVKYYNMLDKTSNVVAVNTPAFPKNVQRLQLSVLSKHCGIVRFEIVKIRVFDLMHLFSLRFMKFKKVDCTVSVSVFPEISEIDATTTHYTEYDSDNDVFSKTKKGDDPSEIFGIHEYAEGDKISRIHWKITAKLDKVYVKDYSLPVNNTITILVDMFRFGKTDGEFLEIYDSVLECGASASAFLLENDIPHRICRFDSSVGGNVCDAIENYDDFSMSFNSILKTGSSAQQNGVLSEYIKDFDNKKCVHLALVTPHFDEKTYQLLTEESVAARYTVFLISPDGIPEEFSKYDDITFIAVNSGNVTKSIQDFCF